ncbi:MAG: oxaloacetate decarboxylase subunit gamma [Actinobacteria bacterium]|nr:OadG family protein [Actinomycetes bacterium]NCD19351.1 oxaloacetate decarboxylase subunit gamma [Actinomycetota bacterium]
MISDGLILTLAGMLVAFAFLGLMAFSTTAMSRAIQRWFPAEEPPPPRPRPAPDDTAIAIAIAAAHLHK